MLGSDRCEALCKSKKSKGKTASTGTAKGGVNTGKADVNHTGSSVTYYGYADVYSEFNAEESDTRAVSDSLWFSERE